MDQRFPKHPRLQKTRASFASASSGRPGNFIKPYIEIPQSAHRIPVQQLCPHASEVVKDLQDAGFEAWIVGGGVRDLLLGKVPKDFDVATSATPEEVHGIFPRCRLIGRRFRLAHVRKRNALIEVATFRGQGLEEGEHETANGRILRDNVWGTVEEDAIRRDFTITKPKEVQAVIPPTAYNKIQTAVTEMITDNPKVRRRRSGDDTEAKKTRDDTIEAAYQAFLLDCEEYARTPLLFECSNM